MADHQGYMGSKVGFGFQDAQKIFSESLHKSFSLQFLLEHMEEQPEFIQHLSKRTVSTKEEVAPAVSTTKPALVGLSLPEEVSNIGKAPGTHRTPEYRFKLHWIQNTEKERPAKVMEYVELLKGFYQSVAVPVLEESMTFLDSDLDGPTKYLGNILSHPKIFHVLLTGQKNNKNASEGTSTEAIAAISFFSDSDNAPYLPIGLCAVSSDTHGKMYGKNATKKPWRGNGLFRFLLKLSRKIHRTLHSCDYTDLFVFVSLTEKYRQIEIFRRLGFLKISHSFKRIEMKLFSDAGSQTEDSERVDLFPFLAEGCIYAELGEFIDLTILCRLFCFSLSFIARVW